VRRWTLITVIVLFVGLVVAATVQLTAGDRQVRCPGPHAHLGGGKDIVRCVTPTPTRT